MAEIEGWGYLAPRIITVKRGSKLRNITTWDLDWLLIEPGRMRVIEGIVKYARRDAEEDHVARYLAWLWDEGYKAWGNRQEPAWWIWKSLYGNLYLPKGVDLTEVF